MKYTTMWKFIKTSDTYKYVSYQQSPNGQRVWMGSVLKKSRMCVTEKEAALFVDTILIVSGKNPVNVLKKK